MSRITIGQALIAIAALALIVALVIGLVHVKRSQNEEAKTPIITKLNSGQNTAFISMNHVNEFLKENKNIRITFMEANAYNILIVYEDLE